MLLSRILLARGLCGIDLEHSEKAWVMQALETSDAICHTPPEHSPIPCCTHSLGLVSMVVQSLSEVVGDGLRKPFEKHGSFIRT